MGRARKQQKKSVSSVALQQTVEERSQWWLITLALALVAFCLMVVSCKQSQKMGNDKFTATVVGEHTKTMGERNIEYPKSKTAEIVSHLVEIKPGGETGRHQHPGPTYMYVLEGTLVVELEDGTQKQYKSGEALVEDVDVWINNKNPGTTPTKFISVILSEKGKTAVVFPEN